MEVSREFRATEAISLNPILQELLVNKFGLPQTAEVTTSHTTDGHLQTINISDRGVLTYVSLEGGEIKTRRRSLNDSGVGVIEDEIHDQHLKAVTGYLANQ